MQNFKGKTKEKTAVKSRRGEQMIEAAMVLPLTILILSALICVIIQFYGNLTDQIAANAAERDKLYETSEVSLLRLLDTIGQNGGKEESV